MGGARAAAVVALLGVLGCRQQTIDASGGEAKVAGADLGAFPLGESATGALSVTSLGADDIQVATIAQPGDAPAGLVVEAATPISVQSGQTAALPVVFTPAAAGTFDIPVNVTLDPGGSQIAHVTATAVAVNLAATPAALSFGKVSLHATSTLPLALSNPSSIDVTAKLTVSGDASFSAAATSLALPAGATQQLQVSFAPTVLGGSAASLAIAPCSGCASIAVPLTGTGVAAVVSVNPPALVFGNLPVGQSATQTFTVSNAGNAPLRITAAMGAGAPPFAVAPAGSQTLQGGASETLTVTYAPTQEGDYQGAVALATSDPASPTVDVPLTGSSGSSALLVVPPVLDFGSVPQGATVTQQILVENVGDAASGVAPLTVQSAPMSGASCFTDQPTLPAKLAAGQSLTIPVSYTAGAAGSVSGSLDVMSDQGNVTVPVEAVSAAVGPCDWTATPTQLDFGLLEPGQQATLGFQLMNVGTDACVLGNVQSTGAPFTLNGGPIPQILLQPGDGFDLSVTFAPSGTGVVLGGVEFSASGTSNGDVALVGSAAQGCLQISPTDLSFGPASATCPPPTLPVTLLDSCNEPVTIDAATISGRSSGSFSVQAPTLPQTLAPGGTSTLVVTYTPAPGQPPSTPDNAALLIDDGEGQPRTVGLSGIDIPNPVQTDTFTQQAAPKVDVLIVMDNSASFETQQQGVEQNAQAFMGAALASGVDFHLGITTTGIEPATGSWTTCPGGANGGEAGRLFPVDNSAPRILTPQTPGLFTVFSDDINVGVCHWDERPFDAAVDALTPPLSTSAKAPGTPWPNDGNLGFLRTDALLQILFIQDDDDESIVPSGYTVQSWVDHYVQTLKELKGPGNEWMVTASAVTATPGCNNPQDLGVRYFQLVGEMGGQILSVCTSDWGATMGQLGAQAFSLRLRFGLTQQPASATQITVAVNGQNVPANDPQSQAVEWSYDTTTNEVAFTPGYAPPSNSTVSITYPVACP